MTAILPHAFKKSPYGVNVFAVIILLALLISPIFYYSFNNYATGTFIFDEGKNKHVYILRSEASIDRLSQVGGSPANYEERLQELNTFLLDEGYSPEVISEQELQNIQSNDTLFLIDALAFDDVTLKQIEHFVQNGGALVFNYYCGFSKRDGTWRGDVFVNKITGLTIDPSAIALKKQTDIFLTPKLFSPLSTYLESGSLMSLVFYEDIPLYKTPERLQPDLYFTDWSQFMTPKIVTSHLSIDSSGAMWHGTYGKGSWIYFNFPANVFVSSGSDNEKYKLVMKGITDYAIKGLAVRKAPYLTDIHPVFISEDTEFKFENAEGFSELVKSLNIPATAFCVGELAEKNPSTIAALAKNPYLEIGSHSYSHKEMIGVSDAVLNKEIAFSKKRLETLTHAKITGFRPPREEIDDKIAKKLIKSGYTYVMEKNKNQLYPKFMQDDFVVIPRTGTDDYDYLAHYAFNETSILEQMKREQTLLSNMDGIYTLSVHTHLFSDPHNLHLIESFLKDTKEKERIAFLQGRTIAEMVRNVKNIDVNIRMNNQNYIVSVANENRKNISKAVIRVYWPRWGAIHSIKPDTQGIRFNVNHHPDERFTDIEFIDLKPKAEFSLLAEYSDAD